MKSKIIFSLLFSAIFLLPGSAQDKQKCLSDEARELKKAELIQTSQRLAREGKLNLRSGATTLLEWPLRQADGFDDPGYYAIINYVDQDNTGGILDYNCGARTYNGHRGIDIMTWPYRWDKMDNDAVEIIAAAPGTILGKDDGNFDKNCDCSNPSWNAVYIQHEDGSIAWYGHMKENSLTTKAVGETVATSEYLGIVGSSGCSTDPHLHFEFYANTIQTLLIEPFAGDCNNLNGDTSWWANQLPYRESKINKLMTHYAPPEQNFDCPADNDIMNASDQYNPGDWIYFSANYQDQIIGQTANFKIFKPDNTLYDTWIANAPNTYSASWWYYSKNFPLGVDEGIWTFQAEYEGETNTHEFQIGGAVSSSDLDNQTLVELSPNPFTDHFNINLSHLDKTNLSVEIYTIEGKRVKSLNAFNENQNTIFTDELPAGLYLVKVKNDTVEITKKLIKL